MRPDDIEFLIAQYAEGSMDAKRAAELEAVLRRDAAARAMLESYRAVDGALAGVVASQPAPEVAWDRLSARLSGQIATLAANQPLSEQAEEAISRLSGGEVTERDAAAIEAAVAADPRSRVVLAEYRSLDRVLETVRSQPMPQIRWERFAEHLSASIDRSEEASAASMRLVPDADHRQDSASSGVLGRIGGFLSQPRRLALAACILIAASVSLRLISRDDSGPLTDGTPAVQPTGQNTSIATATPPTPPPPAFDIRVGPAFDMTGGSTVTKITVGPPTDPGFDMTALADWARHYPFTRPSQSIVGKATTQPDDKATKDSADSADPGALFNQ